MAVIEKENTSYLHRVSQHLKALNEEQQRQVEIQRLLGEFSEKSHKLIFKYGPIKIAEYDRNCSYPYLDPGIARTPSISIATADEEFEVYIEGDFEKDNTPNIQPNSVIARRLSLCFQDSSENYSDFSVNFDASGVVDMDNLSPEHLEDAVLVLGQIEGEYENKELKEIPKVTQPPITTGSKINSLVN